MKIKIDSIIKIINPTDQIKEYCKKELTLKNPEIQRKKSMGFWIGNIPKEIKMFSINENNIIIPFGCIDDIWKIHPIKEDYEINFRNS